MGQQQTEYLQQLSKLRLERDNAQGELKQRDKQDELHRKDLAAKICDVENLRGELKLCEGEIHDLVSAIHPG